MTVDLLTPLRDAIARAAQTATGAEAEIVLKAPADPDHGDLATPVAMALAKIAGRPPRDIAGQLVELLSGDPAGNALVGCDVAGPGFINLRLSASWFADTATRVRDAGDRYGAGVAEQPVDVLLEYVSANPTGPLHVGHARHAAYGDSLGRVLAFAGHRVAREFYVNDFGRQMRMLGASVAARYAGLFGRTVAIPEDGYEGEYVIDIAQTVRDDVGDRYLDRIDPIDDATADWFAKSAETLMLKSIERSLEGFRASVDNWFSETELHRSGRVGEGLDALRASGDAYESEGALWFATSRYGDDQDRVLVRADGQTTYLAADVAYHLDKAQRGPDVLLDVLGADHHGYIARLRAVLEAGGHAGERLEIALVQLVSLVEGGESKKMSKRAGTLVSMDDLVDDIGVDAARFFLVQRSHETPLDLDLALARERSQENPVYYVQYAHTRALSILRQVEAPSGAAEAPSLLDDAERALVLRLTDWPVVVRDAALKRAPHRVTAYLIDLSRDFHAFYHRCRVSGEPADIQAFRATVTEATAGVLRLGLGLLGVSAPERM